MTILKYSSVYSKNMKLTCNVLAALLLIQLFACHPGITETEIIEQGFKDPPSSAKPRTWMHAMSGNMSKEGLTKDLESISEAGIGGVLLFNVSQGIPNGPVKYNSDLHHEMIRHAGMESERLGLSFGVHNCDGWSSSGGPWIKPDQSMKMVVWSDTIVEGGKNIHVQLPWPTKREGFYRDIASLAYPSLESELEDFQNVPVITSSDKNFNLSIVSDGRIDKSSVILKTGDEDSWIQFDFGKTHNIRSVFMVFNDRHGEARLQISHDGKNFETVERDFFKVRTGKSEWDIVDHFETPVKARFFRLQLNQTMTIKEARLMSTYAIQNFLGRSSRARTDDAILAPIGTPEESMIIQQDDIIDLTDKMKTNGMLEASLPAGKWTIMRFGYTSTGAFNHPASDEGRGLECDKFSRKAFKIHYETFVKRVIENLKDVAPNALQYIEIDSYEMGGQNWTDDFQRIFYEKKGYDLGSFLPLYAGRFIESADVSDAVLWDLRDVHCQLMTDNYFGYFTELCHGDGVESYIEPYGNGPFNDLDVGGKADMVMGEFWMNRPLTQVSSAVSSGHIYGKKVISAESFTSTSQINWKGHPAMAKPSGDRAWAAGINEFMFHRFAHQANTHVEPGLTMNRWGFHFDRTQTWWKNAGPAWYDYIARGSFLLRQGFPVSDLLVFIGDGSPNSTVSRTDFIPSIPPGTNFDCVNADVLINRIQLADRHLLLPEGTQYEILVLQNCENLSLETLKRIHEIALAGIPIVGFKRIQVAGYMKSEENKEVFAKLAAEIRDQSSTYEKFNWAEIYDEIGLKPDCSITGREDLDFMHRKIDQMDIYFLHNPDSIASLFECTFRVKGKIPESWNAINGEISKIGRFNHSDGLTHAWIKLEAGESTFIVFRDPSAGVRSVNQVSEENLNAGYFLNEENELVLEMTSNGKYIASFSSGETSEILIKDLPDPFEIKGPWEVEFLKEHGYEALHRFDALSDWKDNAKDNIRHYAGTAIYRNTFGIHDTLLASGNQFILDLGQVHITAAVRLNGKALRIHWMPPFEIDITKDIKAGENLLEIAVTNQWTNRLIGDEQYPDQVGAYQLEGNFPKGQMPDWYVKNDPLPEGPRKTFDAGEFYKASDELMPSGLKGPVRINFRRQMNIQ